MVVHRCGAKRRNCNKCEYHYTKADKELDQCPQCGACRKCVAKVPFEGKRCRMHGGNNAKGPAHYKFTDGKGSKYFDYLPPNVRGRAEAAFNDPELLSIRSDVAVFEARKMELANRLYSGEHAGLWKTLRALWTSFEDLGRQTREALDAGDQDKASELRQESAELIANIGKTIKQGSKAESAWRDLMDVTHETSKLKGEEMRHLQMAQQVLTAEESMRLVAALSGVILRKVTDKTVLGEIAGEFEKIISYTSKVKTESINLPPPK